MKPALIVTAANPVTKPGAMPGLPAMEKAMPVAMIDRQHTQSLTAQCGKRLEEIEFSDDQGILTFPAECHADGHNEASTTHDRNHVGDGRQQMPFEISFFQKSFTMNLPL
ncbi:hypothetical protein OZX57_01170 [Bifidobacterium sp. ESL0682]|uniref:hypothetical protein n=1 Tax=Bifidobacterium sp. ESL0682 TaxID=2983212 RepID=UPI0023F80AB9|nr:hypothetical protein [Bifidobacterium sp. ESL0682]WEV42796.1 hypothetical protein OZX57_01170 [Bifidobacterium sp. ESL0682]